MTSAFPMQAPDGHQDTLYISQKAFERLQALISQEEDQDVALRITVLSGGCSGFQYKFSFETQIQKDDLIFFYKEIRVVTDEISYELLKNVTLDYVQELIGAAFTLKNPNAASSCGCGNSFSI